MLKFAEAMASFRYEIALILLRLDTLKVSMQSDYLFPELRTPSLSKELLEAKTLFAAAGRSERGAVYTRREVVDFILDLSGYVTSEALLTKCILEPSFGDADFLIPMAERLLESLDSEKIGKKEAVKRLPDCVRAIELSQASVDTARQKLRKLLLDYGFTGSQACSILDAWLICDDFLLHDFSQSFDFVIGNPPYVRQESVPATLLREYKKRYSTIYDRADLYVPFIERGLALLKQNACLGFICADRWTKNKYGAPLRKFVSNGFHLKAYVDMYGTNAFSAEVSAYPAITIIERSETKATRIAKAPELSACSLGRLSKDFGRSTLRKASGIYSATVVSEDAPWLLDCPERLKLVRRLEADFDTLEDCECRVGIGVATGADKVFIGDYDSLDVEDECKLPLVMTRDIESGELSWRGRGVINPFNDDGTLKDLQAYPRLSAYFAIHASQLNRRHVAKKNPKRWYRTIDRITPSLTFEPKLLIPDIKGDSHVVLDEGHYYPHHNLYFLTSQSWDLRALQAVLLSGIATLFVSTYTTKMRGGYYRFQAQYIRRIRIPEWSSIPRRLQIQLVSAGANRESSQYLTLVAELYGLNDTETALLQNVASKEIPVGS